MERIDRQLRSLAGEHDRTARLAEIGLVAAAVAHELNNALTPIGTYAELAMAYPDDAELTQKALSSAIEGVERANAIIESVLSAARSPVAGHADTSDSIDAPPDPRRPTGHPAEGDAGAGGAIGEVGGDRRGAAGGSTWNGGAVAGGDVGHSGASVDDGVAAAVRHRLDGSTPVVAPSPPAWVRAAPMDLERVVGNLLENALKAVGGDATRVSVCWACSPWNMVARESLDRASLPGVRILGRPPAVLARDLDAVLIEVSDDGPGVPEIVERAVFDPLVTAPAGPATDTDGGAADDRDIGAPAEIGGGSGGGGGGGDGGGGVGAGRIRGGTVVGGVRSAVGGGGGRRARGTGLGLAICRELVRAGGGAIWMETVRVDADPGVGEIDKNHRNEGSLGAARCDGVRRAGTRALVLLPASVRRGVGDAAA